jgi:hypothetical protein
MNGRAKRKEMKEAKGNRVKGPWEKGIGREEKGLNKWSAKEVRIENGQKRWERRYWGKGNRYQTRGKRKVKLTKRKWKGEE